MEPISTEELRSVGKAVKHADSVYSRLALILFTKLFVIAIKMRLPPFITGAFYFKGNGPDEIFNQAIELLILKRSVSTKLSYNFYYHLCNKYPSKLFINLTIN